MNPRRTWLVIGLVVLLFGGLGWLLRLRDSHVGHDHGTRGKSITDTGIQWPSREKLWRTLSLADYNTRVVFAGVTVLGAASGLVGTFLLLRKRLNEPA
jgi:hypothetical protein